MLSKRWLALVVIIAAMTLAGVSVSGVAQASVCHVAYATIVERIVAVVGEKPILLSDLRKRARPFLIRIAQEARSVPEQTAAETEMYKELLNAMIDERLLEQAADKAHIAISSDDIDKGMRTIADKAKVELKDLIADAKRRGFGTEQDFRDEVRRQLLLEKMIQLRVRNRVRVTEQDARESFAHWSRESGDQGLVDARLIAFRILPGSSERDIQGREVLAEEIGARARRGEDFCKLVEQYSDDTETKAACGSRGQQPLAALVGPLQSIVRDLKEGEISRAVRIGEQAVVVIKLEKKAGAPKFEEVEDVMMQRASLEVLERQKKLWFQELRRGVYLDIRL